MKVKALLEFRKEYKIKINQIIKIRKLIDLNKFFFYINNTSILLFFLSINK